MTDLAQVPTGLPRAPLGLPESLLRLSTGRGFWLLLAGIFFLAVAVRLPGLSDRSLWLDEAYSAWFASLPLHELWTDAPRYETHPPAYYTLLKGWIALFGDGEAAIRSLSLVSSLATVLLVSLAGRLLDGGRTADRVALLGALLLAINPASIVYAQEARPYALQALASTAAILSAMALISPFRSERSMAELRTTAPPTVLLALCAGGLLWLHNTAVFIALGIWVGLGLALLAGTRSARVRMLAAAFLAGLLALAIWSPFLPMLIEQGRSVAATAFWVKSDLRDFWSGWLLVAGGPHLLFPVLLAALLGVASLWRGSVPTALFVACVLLVPVSAMLAIHFALRPFFIDRLVVWLAPPLMMLAAFGLVLGPVSSAIRLLLAVLVIGFSLLTTGARPAEEDWNGILATIARESRPGDVVVVVPSEIDPAFSYYARRHATFPRTIYVPGRFPYRAAGRIYVGNLGAPKVEPDDAVQLGSALAGTGRVWLVSRRANLYDTEGIVRRTVAEGRRLGGKINAWPIAIERFE